MSIIYDALKKVEKVDLNDQEKVTDQRGEKFKSYFLYALVLIAGFFGAGLFFKLITPNQQKIIVALPKKINQPLFESPGVPTSPASSKETTAAKPASVLSVNKLLQRPAPSFVLSGIFFSNDGGYALINNRIVKEGDVIEGAKVIRIKTNSVELNLEGSSLNLSL